MPWRVFLIVEVVMQVVLLYYDVQGWLRFLLSTLGVIVGTVVWTIVWNVLRRSHSRALRDAHRSANDPYVLILRPFHESSLWDGARIDSGMSMKIRGGVGKPILVELVAELPRHLGVPVLVGIEPWSGDAPFLDAIEVWAWQNWMEVFRHLCKNARAVVLFPNDSPGVLAEVAHLRLEGLLGKVLVLMPPEAGDGRVRAAQWTELAKTYRAHGYGLAPYDPRGMLYFPTNTLGLSRGCDFARGLSDVLAQLADAFPDKTEPVSQIIGMLDEWEARGGVKVVRQRDLIP